MDRSYELGAVVKCLGDSDEPMNQLVRFHALTEVYLDIFIESFLPTHKISIKKGFIPYSRKLKTLESHNLLSTSIIASLQSLTRIRNDYSHNPFANATKQSLEDVVKDYPDRVKSVKKVLPDDCLSPRQVAMVIFIELTAYLWDPNEHAEIFAGYDT
jgi:hypothetical protein